MRIIRRNPPTEHQYSPSRKYQPKAPFWDFRASQLATVALTIALIWVGISQVIVADKQANIANSQADIAREQNDLNRSIQHALIAVNDLRREPVGGDTASTWRLSPIIENSGATAAPKIVLYSVTPRRHRMMMSLSRPGERINPDEERTLKQLLALQTILITSSTRQSLKCTRFDNPLVPKLPFIRLALQKTYRHIM
jgi:hypothetical protein